MLTEGQQSLVLMMFSPLEADRKIAKKLAKLEGIKTKKDWAEITLKSVLLSADISEGESGLNIRMEFKTCMGIKMSMRVGGMDRKGKGSLNVRRFVRCSRSGFTYGLFSLNKWALKPSATQVVEFLSESFRKFFLEQFNLRTLKFSFEP